MTNPSFSTINDLQQHMYKLGEYQALVDLGVVPPGDREKEANVFKTLKGFLPGSAKRVEQMAKRVIPSGERASMEAAALKMTPAEAASAAKGGWGPVQKAAPRVTKQAPATSAQLTPQSSNLQQALAKNKRGKTYQTGQQAGDAAFAGRLQQRQQNATSLLTPPVKQPAAAAPTQTAAAPRQTAAAPPAAPPAAAPGSWMPQRWQDARFALQQQPGAGSLGARGPEEWAQAARLMSPELYAAGGAGLLGAGALVGRATAPEPILF